MIHVNVKSSLLKDAADFERRVRALEKDDLSFVVDRLVRQQLWKPESAERARIDFVRFAALTMVTGEPIVPSAQVDEFWHGFLLFTRDYLAWCERHFGAGFFLHHVPGHSGTSDGWVRTKAIVADVFETVWDINATGTVQAADCYTPPPQDPPSCFNCKCEPGISQLHIERPPGLQWNAATTHPIDVPTPKNAPVKGRK